MDYFIADTHFGHKKILNYELSRSVFKSIEDMNETLIDNWNSVVTKNDRVFHLGDFCWGTKNLHYASRLNGIKYLIAGNHDTAPTAEYLKYFHKVLGCMSYKGAILTHMPIHEEQFKRFTFNIHGHLHSSSLKDFCYINVSCEQQELSPCSWKQILDRQLHKVKIARDILKKV